MISLFFFFASSIPRRPVSIPMQMMNLEHYHNIRDRNDPHFVFIVFQTNTSRGEKGDVTDLYQSGAEISAAFVRDGIHYGLCYDPKIKYARVACYYPGVPEGYFRVQPYMIPAQVSTKLLHLAARTLKQARRNLKEEKNPGIGRIKNELRNIHKLLKNTADEEARNNLNQTKEALIKELLEAIPDEKREIRLLKLKNKEIADKEERKKANEAVREMKKALNIEKDPSKDYASHKKMKRVINKLRVAWRESHIDESEHNVEEELEKLKFQRKQDQENLEDDSEEVEQMFNLMSAVKGIAGPNDDLGEIDQRYEMIKKIREKRHARQKKEGTYRPRDENGNYLFDDSKIRTSVDDVQNVGLEEVDLSPIKNEKEEAERKKKEISKDKRPPEIPEELIEGQYDGL